MKSLGTVDGNNLKSFENIVNPYTCRQFVITKESIVDTDPNAAGTYREAELQSTFGK